MASTKVSICAAGGLFGDPLLTSPMVWSSLTSHHLIPLLKLQIYFILFIHHYYDYIILLHTSSVHIIIPTFVGWFVFCPVLTLQQLHCYYYTLPKAYMSYIDKHHTIPLYKQKLKWYLYILFLFFSVCTTAHVFLCPITCLVVLRLCLVHPFHLFTNF